MEFGICITGVRGTSYAGRLRIRLSTLRFNPAKQSGRFFCAAFLLP